MNIEQCSSFQLNMCLMSQHGWRQAKPKLNEGSRRSSPAMGIYLSSVTSNDLGIEKLAEGSFKA